MANLDRVLGGVAIVFLLAGMFMLFGGVSTLGQEKGNRNDSDSGKGNRKNEEKT